MSHSSSGPFQLLNDLDLMLKLTDWRFRARKEYVLFFLFPPEQFQYFQLCIIGRVPEGGLCPNVDETINSMTEGQKFIARPKEIKTTNCMNIPVTDRERIAKKLFDFVLNYSDAVRELVSIQPPLEMKILFHFFSGWRCGGEVPLAQLAALLTEEDKKLMKDQDGGLQTFLRNQHQIFHVSTTAIDKKISRCFDIFILLLSIFGVQNIYVYFLFFRYTKPLLVFVISVSQLFKNVNPGSQKRRKRSEKHHAGCHFIIQMVVQLDKKLVVMNINISFILLSLIFCLLCYHEFSYYLFASISKVCRFFFQSLYYPLPSPI